MQDRAIFRFSDLKSLLNISRSTIDRWEKDNRFPKRIVLGENSVGWHSKDIMAWLELRPLK